MMSLWDALRMNMMISYQELVRTFLSNVFLFHFLNKHVAKTDFYLYIFICKILNKAPINHIVNFFTFR
ncbi:hypothetical protein D6X02_16000 [Shigella sonnei]|nr:hypothetical protein [Shigella sonnei]EAB1202863.1 hypothetical protein [Shigella sonnei]EFX4935126.1 hypothetical protein [Shigella sonnei]EFX6460377.1 hypothetical protein [Shigella sonnei]EFX7376211.1 hypothetical protein [Shigella sonnei]